MRFASKVGIMTAALALCGAATGQQKVNPATGISWPAGCEVYNVAAAACPPIGVLTFKGNWSSTVTYGLNDAVYYSGSTYVSLQSGNLNQNPSTATAYWALLVSGSTGYFTGTPTVNVAGTATNTSMVWVATSPTTAAPRQLSADDLLPAFNITSFTCSTCATVEIGQTIASPTNFTSAYTSTPTSASISDGTNTDTLTTPFTSGSLAHSYVLTSAGSICFTLTAVGPTTKTSQQCSNWSARTFGGVGTAGATAATASGTSAVLAGATGTLASNGLGPQSTWGAYNPSSQYIYILSVGSACTFTSGGFSFLMNTPISFTFTNQNGASIPMYLYRSVNSQNAPTTLIGTC